MFGQPTENRERECERRQFQLLPGQIDADERLLGYLREPHLPRFESRRARGFAKQRSEYGSSNGDIDMTIATARQIVLAARPHGKPKLTDFRLEETTIPTPAAGQLLLGVQYLSLDP